MCYCHDRTFSEVDTKPMVKVETKDPDEESRPGCKVVEAVASAAGMKRKQPEDVEAAAVASVEDNPVIVHKKFRKSQSRWPGTSSHQKDLTLEQFTDIVLASEGIRAKAANGNPEGEHRAMVANIMSNKDLTVEVKPAPLSVKPVVLSPRYPNG